jgi:hypothetical protein
MHVDPNAREACALVDLDRPLVERRDGEDKPFRRELLTGEREAGGEEGRPEAAAGEVRPETEADLDRALVPRLEREVADELAGVVCDRPVGLAATRGLE